MEDILASIRRILAEGEDPAPEEAAPPIPMPAPAPSPDDVFVLDQSMMIEEPAPMPNEPEAETPHAQEPTAAEPAPDYSHLDAGSPPPEPLLAPGAAAASSASLGALVRVVNQKQMQVYRNGPTLEDMVREEIRPLVKAWLDENLAPMVERLVRAEIERVSAGK